MNKLIKDLRDSNGKVDHSVLRKLSNTPQYKSIKNATKQDFIKMQLESDKLHREYSKFYNDEKLHLKYGKLVANEEFNDAVKKGLVNNTKEEHDAWEWSVLYDDGDQGQVFDRFIKDNPDHPIAQSYNKLNESVHNYWNGILDKSKSMAREFLGNGASEKEVSDFAYFSRYDWKDQTQYASSIPKTGMNPNSISQRIGNWYKGRTTGETDSTKVSDRILRWQMERNIYQNTQLQKNWDFSGRSAREERNLSKNFVKTVVKDFNNGTKASNDLWRKGDHEGYYKAEAKRRNDAKQAANNYIREVAKIRLKSMGYDVTDKAIDNLISKDWFRNSLWIQNTLASLGADGVNHTSKDDMMFR